MTKIMPHDNVESRFEDLASAIVIKAVEDYKRHRFILDTIDMRKYRTSNSRYIAVRDASRIVKRVENFFITPWFETLSNLDGEKALAGLENTYETEYYPTRLRELLDRKEEQNDSIFG